MFTFEFYMFSLMGHVLGVIAKKNFGHSKSSKFSSVTFILFGFIIK